MGRLPDRVLSEFSTIAAACKREGAETWLKYIRQAAERHHLNELLELSKEEFAWRVNLLMQAVSGFEYAVERRSKIGEMPHWVYRADPDCGEDHQELDGLVIPASSGFWRTYYPPKRWACSCYVLGGRWESSALRLGGLPDKVVPAWVGEIDPSSGAARGTHPIWSTGRPLMKDLIAAILAGEVPPRPW